MQSYKQKNVAIWWFHKRIEHNLGITWTTTQYKFTRYITFQMLRDIVHLNCLIITYEAIKHLGK
jgi:hypothetical protein